MKNSLKNIHKRHQQILDVLEEQGELTTDELVAKLAVSYSTIRRDLVILEEKNDISRKHGYARFNDKNKDRFDETGPEVMKNNIAQRAAMYIKDYHTIFINTSSTALATLNYTTAKNLTIVSNNLKLVNFKDDNSSSYILTGGEMRFPKEALVGDIAIHTISEMNADTCIIGCSGIDIENGVTTKVINEARVNEIMINKTIKNKILVADYRKIGKTSQFKIADISAFDLLITDQYSPKEVLERIEKMGVTVVQI